MPSIRLTGFETSFPALDSGEGFRYQYDIHGLMGIWSNIELKQFPRVFRKSVTDPSIIVAYGGMPGRTRGPDSYTYSYSPLRHLPTTLSIQGTDGRILLEFTDALFRATGGLRPALSNLVSAFFQGSLLLSGRILMHGAVLESNGEGVLLAAPSDTGKTRAAISLVKNHGFKFLSDDMSIMQGSRCLSFPIDLKVERMGVVPDLKLSVGKKFEYSRKRVLWSLPFFPQIFSGEFYISAEDLFGRERMVESTKIGTTIFLEHGPDGAKEIDKRSALNRLISQHKIGIADFDPFFSQLFLRFAYSTGRFDVEKLARTEMNLCEQLIESTDCYSLSVLGFDFEKGILEIMSGR